MSGTGNVGDGFTICDATPELAWQRANSTPGYEVNMARAMSLVHQ